MIARFLGQFIDGTPGDRETVVSRIKARHAQQGFESEGGTEIARGTHILVRLNISSCTAEPTSKLVTWTGSIAKASFIITAPEELQNDLLIGSCTLSVNGMTVGHLAFDVPVRGGDEARAVYGGVVKHAFASYAHEDRMEVLARVAGMEKVGVGVFVDTYSLRSNDEWRERIHSEIDSSDVLYLFWSIYAKQSEEVEHEWRYGLQRKGQKFIDPVPLVDPRMVPPPPELANKHFHDWTLIYLEYERAIGRASEKPCT